MNDKEIELVDKIIRVISYVGITIIIIVVAVLIYLNM